MAPDRNDTVRRSKLIALALRHDPGALGLELDAAGWARVGALIEALAARGEALTEPELVELVRASDKQRFSLSDDGTKIRANQGHSISVDLGLVRSAPPSRLFHGTVARFLERIRAQGLRRGARTHVHLSADVETAILVARRRRGACIVVTVRAAEMHAAGHSLFLSANGVWLTERVPPEYLELPPSER